MVLGDALGGVRADVVVANWSTDSVQSVAGLVVGAVLVVVAHRRDTGYSWVTLGTTRTNALSSVRDSDALCAATARNTVDETRSDAVIVSTRFVVGAVVVRFAFG